MTQTSKPTKRGFGTGGGNVKGSKHKLTLDKKLLLAKVIAGSLDETSLQMLSVTEPKLYAKLLKDPVVKKALERYAAGKRPDYSHLGPGVHKLSPGHTVIIKEPKKYKKKPVIPPGIPEHLKEDAALVKYHLMTKKDPDSEKDADFMVNYLLNLGPNGQELILRASSIRYDAMSREDQISYDQQLYRKVCLQEAPKKPLGQRQPRKAKSAYEQATAFYAALEKKQGNL